MISTDVTKKEKYTALLNQFKKMYLEFAPLSKQYDYFTECLWGIECFKFASTFQKTNN